MNRRVWTTKRKWMGNLIPALFSVPAATFGIVWMLEKHTILGLGLWALVASQPIAWVALNYFGLYGNTAMRAELGEKLADRGLAPGSERYFVGFATPAYVNALDAHEDIGFLCVEPQKLVFVGESRTVELDKAHARSARFRPNVHSLLGLGRWVSVEGEVAGSPVRLLVEPRDAATLLGNRAAGSKLRARLEVWIKGTGSGPKSGAR